MLNRYHIILVSLHCLIVPFTIKTLNFDFPQVAHPPGYPLFTLLAKLFMTVVPLGSVAWRVNLLSAVSGALSSSFIFLAVYRFAGFISQTCKVSSNVY